MVSHKDRFSPTILDFKATRTIRPARIGIKFRSYFYVNAPPHLDAAESRAQRQAAGASIPDSAGTPVGTVSELIGGY